MILPGTLPRGDGPGAAVSSRGAGEPLARSAWRVHRRVGGPEQRLGSMPCCRADGDAEARAEAGQLAGDRCAHGVVDALGDRGLRPRRGLRQEQRELVAADPVDAIDLAAAVQSTRAERSSARSPAGGRARRSACLNPLRSPTQQRERPAVALGAGRSRARARRTKPRRLHSRVSGSWSARNCISSNCAAVSRAVVAWLANTRSACSVASRRASCRSTGSSAQITPISSPPRLVQRHDQPVVAPRRAGRAPLIREW